MNGAYHFPYFVTKEFKEGNRDLIDESLLGDSSFTPQLRALKKLFSKKHTHAGSLVNTTLPACYIYHFILKILQPSAQKRSNAEYSAPL